MKRAEELNRCGECLTLFTSDEQNCNNCFTPRVYWKPPTPFFSPNHKGSQTQTNDNKEKELQNELLLVTVNAQRRIDDQKEQIENLNIKIAGLESKLEDSRTAINELNWQLQNALKGKEQ